MTNAVSGTRTQFDDTWQRLQTDAAPAGPPPSPGTPAAPPAPRRSVAELPDAPTNGAEQGRAGATALATAEPSRAAARDARVQQGLDAFRMSTAAWYHTPSGDVVAAAPFLMGPETDPRTGATEAPTKPVGPEEQAELERAQRRTGLDADAMHRIHVGRGTPEEVRRITQALIDGQADDTVWTPLGVRELMVEHQIGFDCAGYTQQAYLRATGMTADQARFDVPLNESLAGLAGRGYARIRELANVRAGDIIAFDPPPGKTVGHRAIVYDQRIATASDMRTLVSSGAGQHFAVGGPIRVLEMDSSFGSHGFVDSGGAERQTWLYNETTRAWAHLTLDEDTTAITLWSTLYNHPLEGFYRSRGAAT